ncbi:Serine/threonine-protein kinase [Rhizoctonia solani]|uniref:Serine/threonine-protein kinase n=1 Tax=Rhizoctonia solani TaxID=456999 RepID=A0A8H8SX53_9AGAM|nr:Serine/threonine-protein kinase [Rhizoctonia solani]QRW21746.1 Serine/threonine-protein kinase [Rhizoctonia solani]
MRSPSPDPYSDIGTDSTQPQTQPQTESVAQDLTETLEIDPDCWGLLVPCSAGQPSGIIQLKKKPDNDAKQASWPRSAVEEHSFKIGRGSSNDVILPGQKISSQHCTLTWSGRSGDKPGKDNAVVVHDNSSNGTFINGKRIGKTKKSLLTPGDELSFGLPGQDLDDLDYRYIFRRPTEALTAVGNGVFVEYELGPALGRGAFATVRRALHRASGQWFACKVITKSRFVHNPRSRQMFEREVAIMKEFDHPHICKLVAHFEDESTIWLILELISGGDLLEAVINENGLSEEETRQLATEMCLAMEYSHSKGVTHRDLKPENILLTDTVPRHAKIADFGLAKAVDSGTFLKTFYAGYNELVDSWSLGVIVWSMLTNTVPFVEDEEDMYTRFQRRQVDWSQVSSFGLSRHCIDWMKRMLVHDPSHRMSLAQALEHPWLAPLAKNATYERPSSRFRMTTPTDSSGSTVGNSITGSLVSSDPPGSSQALALERCSQDMSSMIIDSEEDESELGSASLVSGVVSVVSEFDSTTHASDTSNLGLVSKFSQDSHASFFIPGRFPHSPAGQASAQPHPLRNQFPPLEQYYTPEMFNTGLLQVPNAPQRSGKAPQPVPDDSMQTDLRGTRCPVGLEGKALYIPNSNNSSLRVKAEPSTPNGFIAQPSNGPPPHLKFNESPQNARQLLQQAPAPAHVPPYHLRPRPGGLSPLRPQKPRERILPAHPGPMREPLPVAPSSPVTATPGRASASGVKRNSIKLEESFSDISETGEGDSPPPGPTGTARPKRIVGQPPTRKSSRVRARLAGAGQSEESPMTVKMPVTGVGARRNNRRHTPLKPRVH